MKKIDLYTDGACSGNPGKGGYAAILKYKNTEKIVSDGFLNTTNNRMELMAAIEGLRCLKEPCGVTLYTDSRYLADGLSKGWAEGWRRKGWKKADGKPAQNIDLWESLLSLCEEHQVSLVWVKGHSDNEFNNRCDRLAVESAANAQRTDAGYGGKL